MGDLLNSIDRAIDAETIIMTRVVDACIAVVRPFYPSNPNGEDPSPLDNPGVYNMIASMYQHTRTQLGTIDTEGVIKEYMVEQTDAKAQALADMEAHRASSLQKTGAM